MAVKPTLLLSPDGSWDANGRVQPTLTGGVRVVPGQYGNAWQVAEATTNLVRNPAFMHASPLTGWSSQFVTTEILPPSAESEQAGAPRNVVKITKITGPSSIFWADVLGAYVIPATGGQPYSGSMWIKGIAGRTIEMVMYFRDAGGYMTEGKNTLTITSDQWDRYKISAVAPTGATHVTLMIYLNGNIGANAVDGESAFISSPQLEEKPYATPYADGSLGAGFAWTGTPHAGASTREGGMVWTEAKDYIDQHRGTVLMRAMREGEGQYNDYMFMLGIFGSNDSVYLYQSANNSPIALLSRTGGTNTSLTSRSMVLGKWESIGAYWDGPEMNLYLGTGEKSSTSRPVPSGILDDRISTSYNTLQPMNGKIESILLFDTALTDAEITEYTAMGAWTYNSTFGPSETIVFPDIRSGLHLVETKIHKSDMYGNIGDEITGEVVTAGITSDLDRAGSKTHIDITAVGTANLLPAGSWITPVQEVSREGEGTVQVQRGVFELDQPEVESAGVRFIVSNSGKDIVDLLARSALLDTFYTPTNGYVMRDIELAIRMLGITSVGPNLVPNGSFENGGDEWLGPAWTGGGAGSFDFPSTHSRGIADGTRYFIVMHSTGSAAGGAGYVRTGDLPVPQGVDKMLLSAMHYINTNTRAYISARFHDAAGVQIPGSVQETSPSGEASMSGGWYRIMQTINVPPDAAFVRLWVFLQDLIGGRANHGSFDDIQLRACTGDLLPASMLALPPSTAKASSRIQHLTSDPRLAAVNDRLAAIGMMAVNATNDSKYTSRMSRDPNKDAAVRQYDIEKDIRITGDIQTWRNTSNKYNRVFAVKEDYTAGTTMTAIAENKDLEDPWNIYRSVLTPKRIDVRDAVDVATLQLAADQELAKASMQESVSFSIVPDPTLSVYDIIEVTGPSTNPAIGKWAIESIDSGLTASDPLMNIGARRTKKGV